MKSFKYVVFIGRFQPFHFGHLSVIETAFRHSEKVILLLGSSNSARSPMNPWTYSERESMMVNMAANRAFVDDNGNGVKISTLANPDRSARIITRPINDYPYQDEAWLSHVQKTVQEAVLSDMNENPSVTISGMVDAGTIGLIGYGKDHSSYYLNMFPNWKSINVDTQWGTISSTGIRKLYLNATPIIPTSVFPQTISSYLASFALTEHFRWLVAEQEFYAKYRKSWELAPFPPHIMCADAVVVQGGNILLVRRGEHPGKGLLALPGGHVEQHETVRATAVRELREETRIADEKGEIPPAMLSSFIRKEQLFDDPYRSQRGRVLTMAYLFRLPRSAKRYKVRGDDDAASAHWYPLGELNARDFHDDHAAIISIMTGTEIR